MHFCLIGLTALQNTVLSQMLFKTNQKVSSTRNYSSEDSQEVVGETWKIGQEEACQIHGFTEKHGGEANFDQHNVLAEQHRQKESFQG